jgi:hypothetical protein
VKLGERSTFFAFTDDRFFAFLCLLALTNFFFLVLWADFTDVVGAVFPARTPVAGEV